MSPRPDVSEERKNQILAAASAVFARSGFHEARMDDIAEEVGLSKGALYLYYKSKDAIIVALLKFFFNQEVSQLRALLQKEQQKSVREQLMTMNRMFVEGMKWMSNLMPVAFEFYAIMARRKEVRLFLKDYFKEYRELLASLIQRGIEQGEFQQTADAEMLAIAITALYEGLALLWMVDSQATQWEKVGEQSLTMLLDGIKA
ncbi:MAG: TetR/AcrR family transcriptional regulator [Ktedonobacteraceae bacterium]